MCDDKTTGKDDSEFAINLPKFTQKIEDTTDVADKSKQTCSPKNNSTHSTCPMKTPNQP